MENLPPLPLSDKEDSLQPPLPPDPLSQVVENDWDSAKGEGTEFVVHKLENKRQHPDDSSDDIDQHLGSKRPCLDESLPALSDDSKVVQEDQENDQGNVESDDGELASDEDKDLPENSGEVSVKTESEERADEGETNETEMDFKQDLLIIDDAEISDTETPEENGQEAAGEDCDSDYIDEDEIDAMLDEDLKRNKQGWQVSETEPENKCEYTVFEKTVLIDRGSTPFDILPENWVKVVHRSGSHVYLNKKTRVCTHSRPYFIGSGSVRRHDVPLSAIPCLQYRRAKEEELKRDQAAAHVQSDQVTQSDASDVKTGACASSSEVAASKVAVADGEVATTNGDSSSNSKPASCPFSASVLDGIKKEKSGEEAATASESHPSFSNVRTQVTSVEEHRAKYYLNVDQVHDYCSRLFDFKKIHVKRFKTWKSRHEFRKQRQQKARTAQQTLPSGTHILTCDVTNRGGGKKKLMLNLKGKNSIAILHEYAQHVLKVKPEYSFTETANAEKPFGASILIENIVYGSGTAASKKNAKAAAAEKALAVLIPDIIKRRQNEEGPDKKPTVQPDNEFAFFDEIKIEDPRIMDLSTKAGQPLPYSILQECLKRYFGLADTEVKMDMKPLKPQRSEFYMSVGKFEAKVICKSKKEGKHKVSQQILQKMHPHVKTWGSILRMYARDVEAIKLKQNEVESDDEEDVAVAGGLAGVTAVGESGDATAPEAEVKMEASDVPGVDEKGDLAEARDVMQVDDDAERVASEEPARKQAATQTEWAGIGVFHKATQYPEQVYTSQSLHSALASLQDMQSSATTIVPRLQQQKAEADVEEKMETNASDDVSTDVACDVSKTFVEAQTQTDVLGVSVRHQSMQFPEDDGGKGESGAEAKIITASIPVRVTRSLSASPRPASVATCEVRAENAVKTKAEGDAVSTPVKSGEKSSDSPAPTVIKPHVKQPTAPTQVDAGSVVHQLQYGLGYGTGYQQYYPYNLYASSYMPQVLSSSSTAQLASLPAAYSNAALGGHRLKRFKYKQPSDAHSPGRASAPPLPPGAGVVASAGPRLSSAHVSAQSQAQEDRESPFIGPELPPEMQKPKPSPSVVDASARAVAHTPDASTAGTVATAVTASPAPAAAVAPAAAAYPGYMQAQNMAVVNPYAYMYQQQPSAMYYPQQYMYTYPGYGGYM